MAGEFGELLHELRQRSGLTQKELAAKSQLSESTIRRYESGRHQNPSAHSVRQLADVLGSSEDEKARFIASATPAPSRHSEPEPSDQTTDSHERRLPHCLGRLTEAAEVLAVAARSRAAREYEHEVARDFPPVHWQPVDSDAEPAEVAEIADFYDQLPQRRLVVLGKTGSGKTIVTLRLALDLLGRRRETDPIPVVLRIGSWDPSRTAFRDWVAAELIGDYPHLAETLPGELTMAAALTEAQEVLPILDGFDEIPSGLRGPALRVLDQIRLPFVLTSRPGEYETATEATGGLADAHVIELCDLTVAAWQDYVLPAVAEGRLAGAVAGAIDTPLLVALARTIYRDSPGADAAELCDESRFPDRAAVERHLQADFIATRYAADFRHGRPGVTRDWPLARVHRWLGQLALEARQTKITDLAWWHVGTGMSLPSRAVTIGAVTALAVMMIFVLLGTTMVLLTTGAPFVATLLLELRAGAVNGCVAGLTAGLIYGLVRRHRSAAPGPSRITMRLGRDKPPAAVPARRGRIRTVRALFGGLAFGAVSGLTLALLGLPAAIVLTYTLSVGVVVAVAIATVVALASWLESPADSESGASHRGFLRANRATALLQMLITWLVGGLILALGIVPLNHLLLDLLGRLAPHLTRGISLPLDLGSMIAIGVTGGATAALVYGFSLTAWGQWIVLGRLWLPLTGKLPWNLPSFLDDAYQRGVLRQPGPVFQFRHEQLLHHVAGSNRPR
ncbi:helix-turn-helix domain-containing protein [Microlunatus sp. GCM10028923]|uniref:helix-turn-helix domain-containing protein n=1 Tax=Microlunatus sp. GCM10028923 TaxID=3273400 RepID=UPI0036171FF1